MANNQICASGCGSTGCGCNSCGNNTSRTNGYGTLRSLGCTSCGTQRTSCGCTGCGCGTNCGCTGCGTTCGCSCNGYGTLRSVAGPISRDTNWNFPYYVGPCGPCPPCKKCSCKCVDSGDSYAACSACEGQNTGATHGTCDTCDCNTCTTRDTCDCDCNTRTTRSTCNDCSCDTCTTRDTCDCGCDTRTTRSTCDCDCNTRTTCSTCHASASFVAGTPVELAAGDAVALTPAFADADAFAVTPEGVQILRSGTYMVAYTVHIPSNSAVHSRFALALNGERVAASAQDVSTEGNCTTSGYSMHAMIEAKAGNVLKLISLNPVSIRPSSASNVFTLTLTRLP